MLASMGMISLAAWAQAPVRHAPIKPVEKQYEIILGNTGDTFSYIPAKQVDSFLRLPVHLKAKDGTLFSATAYEVLYSEWGLFEDTTGREKIMTEYYSMSVIGDTIPGFFRENLSALAKAGDTLTIYKVWAKKPNAPINNSIIMEASSKKFIIK